MASGHPGECTDASGIVASETPGQAVVPPVTIGVSGLNRWPITFLHDCRAMEAAYLPIVNDKRLENLIMPGSRSADPNLSRRFGLYVEHIERFFS